MDEYWDKYEAFCLSKCNMSEREIPTPACGLVCPKLLETHSIREMTTHCVETSDWSNLLVPMIGTLILARFVRVFILQPLLPGLFGGKTGKFLNRKRQYVKLIEKEHLTPNVVRFRYQLPGSMTLGLPVGGFVKVHHLNKFTRKKEGEWNGRADPETGEEIERKYTPVTSEDDKGFFEFHIKAYRPDEHPKFPDGGKSSYKMECQQVGDLLQMSGPYGHIKYLGNGAFKKTGKDYKTTNVAMIAGGSGITPMLQVIREITKHSSDRTNIALIFANQTEDDIILRRELEALQPRLKVHMTLDKPPAGWKGGSGFITKQMIQQHLPVDKSDCIVLLCGPPPMINFACKPNLEALGVDSKRVFEF